MKSNRWTGLCLLLCAATLLAPSGVAQWNPPNSVVSFEKQNDGLLVRQKFGVLKLEVNASDVLHVTYSPLDANHETHPSDHVVIKADWPTASFEVNSDDRAITLSTEKLSVIVERGSGAMHYVVPEGATGAGATGPGSTGRGMHGKMLTTDSYRSLRAVEVNGEKTFHAEVIFAIYGSHEGLYGLGQHQAGVWNYRGETIDLSQENTNIADSAAGLNQRLRHLLEQSFAQPDE